MSERIPAYEGKEPYLFVSYAHLNSEIVMPVIESLFADHYRIWYDEGIAPGSEWPKNIEDHLRDAAAVLVFVSKESLASPNCENEVTNAGVGGRNVYQFTIGEKTHPDLADCPTVKDYKVLKDMLDDSLIGDGITGYQRGVDVSEKKNFWTGIIALAVVLMAVLAVGIYGLNAGWFDSLLPGIATEETNEQEQVETIEENNILAQAAAQQTNEDLMQELQFASEEAQMCFFKAIGNQEDLTYFDLTTNTAEELCLEYADDKTLQYLQYLPELHIVHIKSGAISSLQPLTACAGLKTVYLAYDIFPVEIPEGASFTVIFEP